MSSARKIKVSVTLAADVLEQVDRFAREAGGMTRSAAIESWLRRAARATAAMKLERDTIAHYESLGDAARPDEDAWAELSAQHFVEATQD